MSGIRLLIFHWMPFWSFGFSQDFQGFLNDLQDWELSLKDKDKDKKLKAQASDKEISVIPVKTHYLILQVF